MNADVRSYTKRTNAGATGLSAKQIHTPQQTPSLFDHVAGGHEKSLGVVISSALAVLRLKLSDHAAISIRPLVWLKTFSKYLIGCAALK
jgi:hypothetical protein